MGDEVDRVVAGHVLLLEKIRRIRFAFGEDGHEDIGPRHLGPAGGLHVDGRTLNDALERGRGHRLGPFDIGDQRGKVVLDEILDRPAQRVEIDAAGLHDAGRVGLVDQHEEQMLQRGQLVVPRVRLGERGVDGLFKGIRERGHDVLLQPADGRRDCDRLCLSFGCHRRRFKHFVGSMTASDRNVM